MAPLELDVVVASKIGSLKQLECRPGKDPTVRSLNTVERLEKRDGVVCAAWFDDAQTKLAFAKRDRTVETYDFSSGEFRRFSDVDFGEGTLNSLHVHEGRAIGAVDSGVVKVWSDGKSPESVFEVGGPIEKMVHCEDEPALVATGGKENDLKLWHVETKRAVFEAKNVSHDWLQLRVPVWVSGVCYLPNASGKVWAICSRYGFVRLYDTRAQRRPVCSVDFENQAGSCISNGFREKHVIVGTGRGKLNLVDLRAKGKLDKMYKGAVGAITDVSCSIEKKIVISSSLDRHLRIHDVETKQLLFKQYLTTKLTCFLLRTVPLFTIKEEKDTIASDKNEFEDFKEEISDHEYDSLFSNMEVVSEKIERKKKVKLKILNSERKSTTPIEFKEGNKNLKRKLSENDETDDNLMNENIKKLLKSTEKQKKRLEKERKRKKAKSLFYR